MPTAAAGGLGTRCMSQLVRGGAGGWGRGVGDAYVCDILDSAAYVDNGKQAGGGSGDGLWIQLSD